ESSNPRPRSARSWSGGRTVRSPIDRSSLGEGSGVWVRPGRGQSDGQAAGLQDHGLRPLQVRRKEKGLGGQEEAGGGAPQGGQAQTEDGRARLRVQGSQHQTLPRGRK